MGLNPAQKRAVEYLDGPLLVLAGPGTGKTQLLSHKVAYILNNTDTNPENILCLTFTETGASNMRERLKTIIGKDALKVNIGTYHSFGSEILALYKNYSDAYDRQIDTPIDEIMQFKIINEIQESLPATDILRGDSVKDIISVISEAKSADLTAKDLETVAKQNIEDSLVLSKSISPLLKNIVPRAFRESYENAYLPIFDLLKNYAESKPILKNVERSIAGLARDLKDAIAEAESLQKIKPLSDWKDKYFEKDENNNYRLKDRIANKKLVSIATVMSKYDEKLRENGWYDFDDMVEEAVKVLKNDTGFKLTLEEKYQFIMLDEFQDTNPSQLAIVKALTDYEKPMIMAVGDDDQAIYEFQGALSSNLSDFQAHYGAEVITLTENYRSTGEILDFSYNIIAQAPDRFADKVLSANKKDPKKSQIRRIEFNSSDAEYGFIADEISHLIKSGVPQSEIAVISYKRKYFEPLLPYLKSHSEIKIAYEKRDDLFEDEQIHQLLTISRLAYELSTEKKLSVQILEVLSYPFWNLPMLQVIKDAGRARNEHKPILECLAESESPEISRVALCIADFVKLALNEPLEVVIANIYRKMDIESLDTYTRFRFYENLASLKGKLKKHFGDKPLKLSNLIEMIDDYIAADMPLVATSPYRDADEAVQILSAHKAKGLEFEYVFIISADHVAWGRGKGNNNLLALPKNLMQIRHTGTTDSEKLRILYVALTRAKQALYITNSLYDFNGKSPDRLEYFDEYLENDEVVSPFLPTKKVELCYNATVNKQNELNLKNWLLPYFADSPDMRALYRERVKKFRMSASALTSFIDIAYAGPESFFKSYILQAPREPETEALAYGDLIHKVFEKVTNDKISNSDAVDVFLTELSRKELQMDTITTLREKGIANLAVALERFGDMLRRGQAEVDFGPEKLVIDGVPVTGKIDHILVDDDNKTIEIYDFKTGAYHKEKWQSNATLYKYMLQLLFYKQLLNNSPKYSKYKVTRAHILFVTPDKDGDVHDKIYEFTDDDEKELLSLMQAVYKQIVTLDFLDDPAILIPADNSLGIRDIKNFIELLLAKNL
ncbi:ATP-dependent helicase [Candidatus Saccharibacteria bacterium]|nr:ATP-dependent helicase [Candidatus Saccharibacteria bacterium]